MEIALLPFMTVCPIFVIYWWVNDLMHDKKFRVMSKTMMFREIVDEVDILFGMVCWFFHIAPIAALIFYLTR